MFFTYLVSWNFYRTVTSFGVVLVAISRRSCVWVSSIYLGLTPVSTCLTQRSHKLRDFCSLFAESTSKLLGSYFWLQFIYLCHFIFIDWWPSQPLAWLYQYFQLLFLAASCCKHERLYIWQCQFSTFFLSSSSFRHLMRRYLS